MAPSRYTHVCAVMLLLGSVARAEGQRVAIPEALARAGHSISRASTVPSGPTPTVDDVLARTDLVVRGIVGQPTSRLSEDQRDLYSEYPIANAVVLFRADPSVKLSSPIMVTAPGGTITINGLRFDSRYDALPPLTPGIECVFLLTKTEAGFIVAGEFYGAFRIVDGLLHPMTNKGRFAEELKGVPASQGIGALVSRLQSRRRRR